MKKIGIICNLMTNYGGVQTCVISLIKGLNKKGITPILLSDNEPRKELWEEQGLDCDIKKVNFSISADIYNKYKKYLMPFWEFIFYFKSSWLKDEYDFIYIFQPNVMIDNNQKHLYYLSMSPRAHNFSRRLVLSKIKTNFYNIFLKRIHPIFEFQNYNCVINSEYTAKMFFDYYDKKINVIYPSNSVEEYIPKKIIKKEKTAVFLSRLAPYKNAAKVLELAKKNLDYTFYIIGSVEEKDDKYVADLKNKVIIDKLDNIKILINLPYKDVIQYLTRSVYYVFFAKNEHFGITTVEAILFGCIPFVHNSGGQIEIVPDNKLRFEYDNMEEKFKELINMDDFEKEVIKKRLEEDILNFKENVFITKMNSYLLENND